MTSPNYCFELLKHEALPAADCGRLLKELGYGASPADKYHLAQILEHLVVAAVPGYRTQFLEGADVVGLARALVAGAADDCRLTAKKQAAIATIARATTNLWLLLGMWAKNRADVRALQLEDARQQALARDPRRQVA